MAPLPALVPSDYENLSEISGVALYDRHKGTFKPGVDLDCSRVHNSFEECRAAMVTARVEDLETQRQWCHTIACEIEHIRTIPAVPFPEVVMEPTPEAPAPEPPTPPAKSDGGFIDPSVPYLVGKDKPKAELKRPSRKAQ
jgi:hypothetical protein